MEKFYTTPVVLLRHVLQKVKDDRATTLLVAPHWPGQSWYPQLLLMLKDSPLRLHREISLLSLPFDPEVVHPLWRSLRLNVWPISGDHTKQQASHHK